MTRLAEQFPLDISDPDSFLAELEIFNGHCKRVKEKKGTPVSSIVGDFQGFLWRIVADLWRIVADLIIIHVFLCRINYYSCNQVIIIHAICIFKTRSIYRAFCCYVNLF